MTAAAILAAERLIRELRFHEEKPRPERIMQAVLALRSELDLLERDVTMERDP